MGNYNKAIGCVILLAIKDHVINAERLHYFPKATSLNRSQA